MNITKELTKLKDKIDSATNEKSKLEGQNEEIMSRLKDDFETNTIEEVSELLKEKVKKHDRLEERLEDGVSELKEELETL